MLILACIALLWSLLVVYGSIPLLTALTDACLFGGLLAVCGILSWYFFTYIRVWQAQVAMALSALAICVGACYTVVTLLGLEDADCFIKALPLRLSAGVLYWIVLMQGYHILHLKEEMRDREREKDEPVTDPPQAIEPAEWIDRISVKDGVRIHIVRLDELLYIQACGDYVTLFTATGQYIKEQTMKYFETHLSAAAFVRIHRSTIVNTNQIMRVELFGKESYSVRLKNGSSLRASIAGYKLLKERLNL
jgi:DNA-binding LytR/AlgR family response regulator